MSSENIALADMRDALIEKAIADAEFRSRLLADPKAVVKEEFGFDLPSDFTVEVHEERLGSAHLVLPPREALDESELKTVAGGGASSACGCSWG